MSEEISATLDVQRIKERVVEELKTVYDPEIPINIYELGLIYQLEISETGFADVEMTLTSPMCPVAGSLPGEVEAKVKSVSGVSDARVELVWDPPWSMDMLTEEARLQLGMDY
jgi:FeS assembly SUF system protein